MATKLTVLKVSATTAKRLKEIKKQSGVALGRLADIGLDHFSSEVQNGNVVIQNGEVIRAPAEAE